MLRSPIGPGLNHGVQRQQLRMLDLQPRPRLLQRGVGGALTLVRLLGLAPRLDQLIFKSAPLAHGNEDAGISAAAMLLAHGVEQNGDVLPALRAQGKRNLVHAPLHLQEGIEVRLVEHAAAGRKDRVQASPPQLVPFIPQETEQGGVGEIDSAFAGECEKPAGSVVEEVVHSVFQACFSVSSNKGARGEIFLNDSNGFIGMAQMRAMTRRVNDPKRAAGDMSK